MFLPHRPYRFGRTFTCGLWRVPLPFRGPVTATAGFEVEITSGIYDEGVSPYLWVWSGIWAGVCLSVGTMLQLNGLSHLPASQVEFITTLYVSMIPVLAFAMGYMSRPLIIIGLLLGVTGIYYMAAGDSGSMDRHLGLILVANIFPDYLLS